MRIFNQYTFTVGNTEFSGIFALVDSFLQQQGLRYEKLCCELRDGYHDQALRTSMAKDRRVIPNRKSAVVFGLEDLLRDHPLFSSCGRLIRREKITKNGDELVWSDMDAYGVPVQGGLGENEVRELARLFPVPYFLESVLFSYVNIDFFGRKMEPVLESSDSSDFTRIVRNGCHISFMKETVFYRAAKLVMVIEVTDQSCPLDSEPYAQALSNILGKKYTAETILQLTEEERLELENRKKNAQPLVDTATEIIANEASRFGQQSAMNQRNIHQGLFKAGKNLKKIGKAFGFIAYKYDPFNVHYLSMPIGDGHTLTLSIDVPPGWNEMRLSVHLTGLGFRYKFPLAEVHCESQEEADCQIKTAFEIVQELAGLLLLPICSQYLATPHWYVPNVK